MIGFRVLLPLVILCVGTTGALATTLERLSPYAHAKLLREDSSLHATSFAGESLGLACGDRGTILRSVDGGVSWTLQSSRVDCRLDDVVCLDEQRAVIVGGGYDRITNISRGVVLYTTDGGKTWLSSPDQELPRMRSIRSRGDGSLEALGDWSDSLLTNQFESHDGGKTWQGANQDLDTNMDSVFAAPPPKTSTSLFQSARSVGVPVAIRDACRIRGDTLCAVGDHGVIFRSDDGGKSWTNVRGQQRQTAILVVANSAKSVAWSLIGNEALENRHRVSVLVHQESPSMEQVAMMLGAASIDHSPTSNEPVRTAGEWLYVHRPTIVVLDSELPAEIRDAYFQAATRAGIARVVNYSTSGAGRASLHHRALLPKLGVLASDLHSDAMQFLAPLNSGAPDISLRYLYDATASTNRGDSVADGINLSAGKHLAVQLPSASRRQIQIAQARMSQPQRIDKLLTTAASSQQFSESVTATLDQTAKADQFRVAWSLYQATHGKQTAREISLHETMLELIADRFASTSAGRFANLRLASLRNSLEWRQLRPLLSMERDSKVVTAAVPVPVSPFQVASNPIAQVSATSPVLVAQPDNYVLSRRATADKESVDLAWEFHPMVLFSRESARIRNDDGSLQPADGESANLRRLKSTFASPWSALVQPSGSKVIIGRHTDTPPRLDGLVDDKCWQSAIRVIGSQQRLRVAFDDEYVYLAFQCPASDMAADKSPTSPSGKIRDHDLSAVDRLRIRIDRDRDLLTAMELQVSDARRTLDTIDGVTAWQPTWYPAIQRTEDHVSVEIAILRRDLADLPITNGESWHVSTSVMHPGQQSSSLIPQPHDWVRVIFTQ